MIEVQTYADGNVKLRAFGEFSCTSAVSLRHLVDDSLGHGLHLIIDLGGVERVDAEGLSALVGSARRARAAGDTAQVINVRPRVRRVFELAGVAELLIGSSATTDDVA